ncbi:MAG: error-prone DNA polymerase [Phycisphaerales bacterium]|nr:error-prone DNA polymerase [Phycisphaerales bacterium]
MPGQPPPKPRPHPFRAGPEPATGADPGPVGSARGGVPYAELDVTSNFTFLHGASHPEELVLRAGELGLEAIALTDTNTLGGIVRAHVAAREHGVRLVVGCRIVMRDPPGREVLVYPTDRASYARLCRLLTSGKRRAEKGECDLGLVDLLDHAKGLMALALPPDRPDPRFGEHLHRLREAFGEGLSLAIRRRYDGLDHAHTGRALEWSAACRVPLAATNAVLYHAPERRPLQDVLTCIRRGVRIDGAGYALAPNAERHLKAPEEMFRLFAGQAGALERSAEIARRCRGFSLDQVRYEYPHEIVPEGATPIGHLRDLVRLGAGSRYPGGVPQKVHDSLEHELALIDELNYAPYFLTVHDLVRYARTGEETPGTPPAGAWREILCQGRGAAANSAVCYCLGVTSVDPDRASLLFERFISRERNEPPDIDIDFEHERREEVIQYIYRKYGRQRAALTSEIISYRGRSAIRDVGKAMGLSLDCVDRLAKTLSWWDGGAVDEGALAAAGLDPRDRTIRLTLHLCRQIIGFPRHRSQHVGGFVMAHEALCELVPIENAAMPDRTVIEWDKDDIDAVGMLKVDCLGLGMLTCIRKAFELVREHHGRALTLASVPAEDAPVYDMICRADTVGVFQIESRAQMAMLPRLRPRCFYDLVIEVAIVRPGPIQGKMVHPYLRRRNGEEAVAYPNEAVRAVLGRTLGVPLFQEQAMQLAIVAAGFTPGEADQLRRAMAAWKRKGDLIERFGEKLMRGMAARGYDEDFASRCFEQIKGFSEYGFPESHAASFALLVYVSCWLKHHYPCAFAAALLNSQPMGFYQPAQIVRDAQEHGVEVRAIDMNASRWDCTLEPGAAGASALRLGMRLVRGLAQDHGEAVAAERDRAGPYASVDDLRRRIGMPDHALRALARADALTSLNLDRQHALWSVQVQPPEGAPLLDRLNPVEPPAVLPVLAPASVVAQDYQATGLSLRAHPVSFIRAELDRRRVMPARQLADEDMCAHGTRVRVAGMVLVRQRPGTASGIVFVTIEDETGIANLIVRPRVFERFKAAVRHASTLLVSGRVERAGAVVHVQVEHAGAIDHMLGGLESESRDFH